MFRFSGLVLVVLLLAGGCSHVPKVQPDPEFAPFVPPEPPPPGMATHGAIYVAGFSPGFYQDLTAFRVGDILTLVLSESTAATTSATTSTQKNDSVDLGATTLLGRTPGYRGANILDNVANNDRSFSGAGDSAQSNSLDGQISVTVVQVFPNGNLEVRGEKIIGINQGSEFVRVAGIVRPQDIRPDNTVLSSRVANARFYYGGDGALADVNRQGWLGRIFSSEYWPF